MLNLYINFVIFVVLIFLKLQILICSKTLNYKGYKQKKIPTSPPHTTLYMYVSASAMPRAIKRSTKGQL